VGLACASKLRKLLAAERIEPAEGGAFALIALERVVAFPAERDTRWAMSSAQVGKRLICRTVSFVCFTNSGTLESAQSTLEVLLNGR
jgi:phage FluMu protein gp41